MNETKSTCSCCSDEHNAHSDRGDRGDHSDCEDGGGRGEILRTLLGAALFAVALGGKYLLPQLPWYIILALFLLPYGLLAWELVGETLANVRRGHIFDENLLMLIASAGALALGDYPEAVAVLLFNAVGEYFEHRAAGSARRSITALLTIRPDTANLLQGGEITAVAPEDVAVGDLILVRPGERVPLDGVAEAGTSALDLSALTGESLPRDVSVGSEILSGGVNVGGALTVRVTRPFALSTVNRIIELVESAASKKARAEHFVTRFARVYTPIIAVSALLLAVAPPLLLGGEWSGWIRRALVFLVVSCPCALVISVPLGFVSGLGQASRRGVLIKGSSYLDALADLKTAVFDKTGTLTRGVFEVRAVYPEPGVTRGDLLRLAAHAETYSTHPIATSIEKAYEQESGARVKLAAVTDYAEAAGHGVSARVEGKRTLAGGAALLRRENVAFTERENAGTTVYLARDGAYLGCIVIADETRADARNAVASLAALGVDSVMLTGDSEAAAARVADEVGIAARHASLLPQDKVALVEKFQDAADKRSRKTVAFVGDGINDAPVLARADIGIAMGGLGSDAAIEAADIVLMTDEPSKLPQAVAVARSTRRIVSQNVAFALSVKGVILLLGVFGLASMWLAVFADVGVALLAILNSTRAGRV